MSIPCTLLFLTYICRRTILSLVIWPSVWPLDHGSVIAAVTAL